MKPATRQSADTLQSLIRSMSAANVSRTLTRGEDSLQDQLNRDQNKTLRGQDQLSPILSDTAVLQELKGFVKIQSRLC